MKLRDKLKARATIRETARRFGITPEQCKADMQAAIDEGWRTEDPAARAYWAELFPDGRKPTVEEFIIRLAGELR